MVQPLVSGSHRLLEKIPPRRNRADRARIGPRGQGAEHARKERGHCEHGGEKPPDGGIRPSASRTPKRRNEAEPRAARTNEAARFEGPGEALPRATRTTPTEFA